MTLIKEILNLKRDPSSEEEMIVAYNYLVEKSRDDFQTFRRAINGKAFIDGWFPRRLAEELQQFYIDYKKGLAPTLLLSTPPQHGKSVVVIDFLAWVIGKEPEQAHIFSSFSDRLGVRANKGIKRIISSKIYSDIFNDVRLSSRKGKEQGYASNDNFFELPNHNGSFKNVTCGGAITGQSITGIGVIDDPIKGRQEANSDGNRKKIEDWYSDDWSTRFDERAAQIIIMTRWHISDLMGSILETEEGKNARYIRYPAIATEDEEFRSEGDALFPEFKSKEFLLRQKSKMVESSWTSLYQQDPVIQGGNLFKHDWWNWWEYLPKLSYKFITVDTAQKIKQQNDYTVMQCWGVSKDSTTNITSIYLLDMYRGKLEAPGLRKKAKEFYNKHKHQSIHEVRLRHMYIEDKSSGSSLIQDLRLDGYSIRAVQRNIDKVSRANDATPYIESGRVYLNKNIKDMKELVTESLAFPNGSHDDTLDPLMDAIDIAFIGTGSSAVAAMMA